MGKAINSSSWGKIDAILYYFKGMKFYKRKITMEWCFSADPDLESGLNPDDPEPTPERKRTPQQIAAEQRLKHTQKQVDEVN